VRVAGASFLVGQGRHERADVAATQGRQRVSPQRGKDVVVAGVHLDGGGPAWLRCDPAGRVDGQCGLAVDRGDAHSVQRHRAGAGDRIEGECLSGESLPDHPTVKAVGDLRGDSAAVLDLAWGGHLVQPPV
jgi:hypothetical protein